MLMLCFLLDKRVIKANKDSNYAAVAADTFSSELGILSKSKPRLITSPTLREVPPGTNGGVTAAGLLAGIFGAFTVALTSAVLLPFDLSGRYSDGSELYVKERALWTLAMTAWGALGSVLDSVLGSLLQASVVDKATGRVVEGDGGRKVSTLFPFFWILLHLDSFLLTMLYYDRFSSTPLPLHPVKVDVSRLDATYWTITW